MVAKFHFKESLRVRLDAGVDHNPGARSWLQREHDFADSVTVWLHHNVVPRTMMPAGPDDSKKVESASARTKIQPPPQAPATSTRNHNHARFFRRTRAMSSQLEKAEWDETRDRFLLKSMRKQVRQGKRAQSGFKKEAWTAVVKEYNEKFTPTRSLAQIKTRISNVCEPMRKISTGTKYQPIAQEVVRGVGDAERHQRGWVE
jgi:hypothetical protein